MKYLATGKPDATHCQRWHTEKRGEASSPGNRSHLYNTSRRDEEPFYEKDYLWWGVYCGGAATQKLRPLMGPVSATHYRKCHAPRMSPKA